MNRQPWYQRVEHRELYKGMALRRLSLNESKAPRTVVSNTGIQLPGETGRKVLRCAATQLNQNRGYEVRSRRAVTRSWWDVKAMRLIWCDRLALMAMLFLMHLSVGKTDSGLLGTLAELRLSPVILAMHKRTGDPRRIEQLAAIADWSSSRFGDRFAEKVSQTSMYYIRR